MKNLKLTVLAMVMAFFGFVGAVNAQEEAGSASAFSTGVDLYSSYVWRGTNFAGPVLQPFVEYAKGGLTVGAWGSQDFANTNQEMDLYVSYGFDFGLSLGLTDYYYPGSKFFDLGDSASSHAHELNLGYEKGNFTISANYIFNEAQGAGSAGGDMYFELGYSFGDVDVFVGAGDGWHTSTGELEVCNIGVATSKEIKITDSFSLPVSGSVILNPQTEQFFIVAGISF